MTTHVAICANCGAALQVGALACARCGAPAGRPAKNASAGAHPTPPSRPINPLARPVPSPGRRRVYSSVWVRLAALVIDAVLPAAVLYACIFAGFFNNQLGGAVVGYLAGSAFSLVYAVLLWAMLATKGTSPGKALLKIRVVRGSDNQPLGWGRALLRLVVRSALLSVTVGIAGLSPFWDSSYRRRAWWDRVADTAVVDAEPTAGGVAAKSAVLPSVPRAGAGPVAAPVHVGSSSQTGGAATPVRQPGTGSRTPQMTPGWGGWNPDFANSASPTAVPAAPPAPAAPKVAEADTPWNIPWYADPAEPQQATVSSVPDPSRRPAAPPNQFDWPAYDDAASVESDDWPGSPGGWQAAASPDLTGPARPTRPAPAPAAPALPDWAIPNPAGSTGHHDSPGPDPRQGKLTYPHADRRAPAAAFPPPAERPEPADEWPAAAGNWNPEPGDWPPATNVAPAAAPSDRNPVPSDWNPAPSDWNPVPAAPAAPQAPAAAQQAPAAAGHAPQPARPAQQAPPAGPVPGRLEPLPPSAYENTKLSPRRLAPLQVRSTVILDSGELIDAGPEVLIGRDPARGPEDRDVQLIPILDNGLSVSKTHLKLAVVDDVVLLTDRRSTNGSGFLDARGALVKCVAGVPMEIPVGATIVFGNRQLTIKISPRVDG